MVSAYFLAVPSFEQHKRQYPVPYIQMLTVLPIRVLRPIILFLSGVTLTLKHAGVLVPQTRFELPKLRRSQAD